MSVHMSLALLLLAKHWNAILSVQAELIGAMQAQLQNKAPQEKSMMAQKYAKCA